MANLDRKLGRHHLAFYRGWLQGLALKTLADRYLETGLDLFAITFSHSLSSVKLTILDNYSWTVIQGETRPVETGYKDCSKHYGY